MTDKHRYYRRDPLDRRADRQRLRIEVQSDMRL